MDKYELQKNKLELQNSVTEWNYKTNLLLKELFNYYCIKSWLQNLRCFVAEWALEHNHPLFPLSRAISQ